MDVEGCHETSAYIFETTRCHFQRDGLQRLCPRIWSSHIGGGDSNLEVLDVVDGGSKLFRNTDTYPRNCTASYLASRNIRQLGCYFAKHGNIDAVSEAACKWEAENSSFQIFLHFRLGILILHPYFGRVGRGGCIAHTMVQQARLSAVVPPFPQPHRMTRKGYDVGDIAVILAVTVKMAILLACVIVYWCVLPLYSNLLLFYLLRLRKPQVPMKHGYALLVSTRLSSAAEFLERSHPLRSSFLNRSIYCKIRLSRA